MPIRSILSMLSIWSMCLLLSMACDDDVDVGDSGPDADSDTDGDSDGDTDSDGDSDGDVPDPDPAAPFAVIELFTSES